MAKGKKKKNAVDEKATTPEIVARVEGYLDVGNFAAIQRLAAEARGAELDASTRASLDTIVEKVRTDPLTWAIGFGAIGVALLVALLTLGA